MSTYFSEIDKKKFSKKCALCYKSVPLSRVASKYCSEACKKEANYLIDRDERERYKAKKLGA